MQNSTNKLVRPSELMKNESVKKRFRTSQNIGYFLAIFRDKIQSRKCPPTVFVDETEFMSFLEYVDKFQVE